MCINLRTLCIFMRKRQAGRRSYFSTLKTRSAPRIWPASLRIVQ